MNTFPPSLKALRRGCCIIFKTSLTACSRQSTRQFMSFQRVDLVTDITNTALSFMPLSTDMVLNRLLANSCSSNVAYLPQILYYPVSPEIWTSVGPKSWLRAWSEGYFMQIMKFFTLTHTWQNTPHLLCLKYNIHKISCVYPFSSMY